MMNRQHACPPNDAMVLKGLPTTTDHHGSNVFRCMRVLQSPRRVGNNFNAPLFLLNSLFELCTIYGILK